MIDCWNLDPDERPKARELYTGLKRWTPEMSASIQASLTTYQYILFINYLLGTSQAS